MKTAGARAREKKKSMGCLFEDWESCVVGTCIREDAQLRLKCLNLEQNRVLGILIFLHTILSATAAAVSSRHPLVIAAK